jgi:hypothetical protein
MVQRIARVLGWLSMLATLALLSGVIATPVRADEPAPTAGPECPVSAQANEEMTFTLAQMIDRLRSEASDRDQIVNGVQPLNTRGFNYVSPAPRNETERR